MDPGCRPQMDDTSLRAKLHQWLELTTTFFILLLCSWLGMELSHHSEGVATIWLTNGMLFAIVIRRPQPIWLRYFVIGLIADTLGDVIYGVPFLLSLGGSLANLFEVALSALLLAHWFGTPFNLTRRKPLLGFLGIAVVGASAITAALAVSWTLLFTPPSPWWQLFRTWYLGDALGMAIIAPLVFILQRPDFFVPLHKRRLPHTLLVLTLPALATILVFSHSADSLMFAIFPALLIVVFRLGFPGTVLAIFVIACTSISLTVMGYGPLALLPNATMLHKIVIVQIFLASALLTCFPVAALLEERKSLELSLQQSEAEYRELANTDALTGQGNRRAFDGRMMAEWYSPDTPQQPLALLSIDVDLFKAYNDIYGHIAGDECLRRITTVIAEAILQYPSARLFRLGGEEFAVILPATASDAALSIAERLREAVLTTYIEHSGSPLGIQTISIGVATATPSLDVSVLSLLNLSDQALYHAKHLGRNRVEAAQNTLSTQPATM